MAHPTIPPTPKTSELKKVLVSRGFEIYRTAGPDIALAERVRDNLLMDGAVAACTGEQLRVRFVVRAEASGFPGEGADQLFARARLLAAKPQERGYRETSSRITPIADPGDKSKTLDTWYEVIYERPVGDLDELATELRAALALEKSATGRQ